MWLPDSAHVRRAALALSLLGSIAPLAGCTVRPLYAKNDMGTLTGAAADLSSVTVSPVTTRTAQEVRNHLIFLLGGGAGQPAAPRYTVALNVVSVSQKSATIQIVTDEEPTAAQIVMTSNYIVTDNTTGKAVARGRRQMVSSYDVPRQEFAVLRARRDAENRAARELAELLRLAIAQDMIQIERTPVSPT